MVSEEEEKRGRGQQKEEQQEEEGRYLCDFCLESKAVVYCRADSAGLCLGCDRDVHAANTVSSKHPRSLLCNLCRSAPSSILVCSSHHHHHHHGGSLVLCANCDFDAHNHNPSSASIGGTHHHHHQHDRRAVEPFFGCPSASEMARHLLLGGGGGAADGCGDHLITTKEKKKEKEEDDDEEENETMQFGVWDMPTIVRLEDLIIQPQPPPRTDDQTQPNSSFLALSHSPPPMRNKNQKFTCGKQKEEILQQLHVLMKSEAQLDNDCEQLGPISEFLSVPSQENVEEDNLHFVDFNGDSTLMAMPTYEQEADLWNDNEWNDQAAVLNNSLVFCRTEQQTESSSAVIAPLPEIKLLYPVEGVAVPLTNNYNPDVRDSAISRYKEKRKTRRYDKLIRYESRKARADSRVRINGRFAKVLINHDVPKP